MNIETDIDDLMNELMDFFTTDGTVTKQVHTPSEAVGNTAKANTARPKKVVKASKKEGWEEF